MYEFLSCRQIPCRIQKYKKSADGKNGLNFVDCFENLTFEQIRIRNMKALFLFLFLTFSLIALSQDGIVIHLDGQTADISGQSHTVAVTSGSAFDVQFHVINETGQNVNWRVSRKKLVTPNNWGEQLCWGHATDPFGGTCYSSSQMNSNPWTTPANQGAVALLPSEYAKLKITTDPEDNTYGQAHFRYYITANGLSMLDSVDLIVDYTASVKPVVKEELNITVAPNPSTEYVNISFTGAEQMQLKMMDALGNVISKEVLTGNRKLNVSDLNSGVYFLVFEAPGSKSITRKLVVRH
ncbi:MAG: hypothetical protein RLZZ55_1210 [Bacteroidota bacterium]